MWGCDPDPIRHPAEAIREKPRKPQGAFCGISRFISHPQYEIWRARTLRGKTVGIAMKIGNIQLIISHPETPKLQNPTRIYSMAEP